MKKTLFSLVAVLSLAGAALADQTPDHKVLVLKNKDGAAILGYDAVAYFTDNKPAKGNPKFQSEYEGAKYYFASASLIAGRRFVRLRRRTQRGRPCYSQTRSYPRRRETSRRSSHEICEGKRRRTLHRGRG